MTKFFFSTCAAILCAVVLIPTSASAQKNKKEKANKADKAPFEWQMPALTGKTDFDNYLKECDVMWKRLSSYKEGITFYKIDTAYVKGADGQVYRALSVVDQEGNKKSSSSILMQNLEIILNGTMIITDMGLMSASATLATASLPDLGLKAISYAKYVKQGYQIVGRGGKEIKEIVNGKKDQAAQLRAIKQGSVDVGDVKSTDKVTLNRLGEGESAPENIDIAALDASFDMGDDSEAIPIDEEKLKTGMDANVELPEDSGAKK